MRGRNVELKIQKPRNCLTRMLDYVAKQMRKVNREKGHWNQTQTNYFPIRLLNKSQSLVKTKTKVIA